MKNILSITVLLPALFLAGKTLAAEPPRDHITAPVGSWITASDRVDIVSTSKRDITRPARAVLNRIIGKSSSLFVLSELPSDSANDVFEVEASGGKVTIRGNSPVALTRGVYHYLRNAVHRQITWSDRQIRLPKRLPDFPKTRINTPFRYRLYYNVCAFGYTTVYWSWPEWEQEIDWMALHGINMPLAMIGQEAIWKKVWKDMGATDKELEEYFTGPAFLPWHRMGNVNKHGGPLPESYLKKSVLLQKKILGRMRELGMEPIVPAFSGYVPPSLERILPEEKLIKMKPWAGFPEDNGTYMLSPLSKHFTEIGSRFMREYARVFGRCHFYLADAFNEMQVPVSKEGRYKELGDFGEAIYKAVNAGDTNGTWVMQGWLFYNDSRFWDKPTVKAFLKNVPDGRMAIIDLSTERFSGWKMHEGFYGKQWINSIIHNFGGNNQLFGDIPLYAHEAKEMQDDPNHGNVIGYGLSPEGIENNEIVYEFLTDVPWSGDSISVSSWVEGFARSRYGSDSKEIREAWENLLKAVYSGGPGNGNGNLFQSRPALKKFEHRPTAAEFDKALDLLFSTAKELRGNSRYRNDIVETAAHFVGNRIDYLLSRAIQYHMDILAERRDKAFDHAFELMKKLDGLLNTEPKHRLERWLRYANKWAGSPSETAFYESDAKRQITTWGGPELSEYAAKIWSGLIRDYYLPRWQKFATSLRMGGPISLLDWEEGWIRSHERLSSPVQVADPIEYAKELVRTAENYSREDQQ